MILTAIFDDKSKSYDFYSVSKNEAQAMRNFEQACLDPNSILSKYPDFSLVSLATWDDSSSSVVAFEEPKTLLSSGDIISRGVDNG